MRKDHAIALEQVERESRSFVAVTGALVTGTLDRTQVMLARAARVSPGAAVATDPALINVVATDALGNVAWDRNGAPIEPRRLSDMTLLRKLASTPDSVRYVSGAFADTDFGQSPFAVAMRSDSIAGQYVFALIDPKYLTTLLESVQGSRSVGVILADAQTRRVASTAVDETLYARVASVIPATASTTPSLRYITDSGSNYLTTTRLLPGYDLRLVTVVRAADALSQWYQSLPLYSIMIFGPSLLGAALAWALLTQIERTSRADTVLRRTEERFELAVSGAKCGIWDWDIANRRLYWSGAMNALLGRGKQPRIMSLDEAEQLIHPDDRFVLGQIESSVRSGADGYDRSFRAKHSDGHWVWMRAKGQHYQTLRSEDGRLSGIVIDISDQKRADARGEAAERVLEAAFENAAEAFVLYDRDDHLIVCNKRFQEFYGIDGVRTGESRDAIFKRAKTPGEGADTDAPLEMFDTSGNTGTIELQKAGNRWLLVSERRALDGGKIAVATDITALKAHEDELESSRNLLQAQTRELSDLAKHLEAEKDRAEEGSRAKSEFLANVSHELRTPLNAIIGFSDVMRNEMLGPLPPRYAEYASDINRSGQHLLDLINDALSMARIESGKIELEFVPTDPSQLVNDAIKNIKPKADEAGLQFRVNTPELPPVRADRRAIKQVLLNLLSNAIKFNSSDGFITVETRADGNNGVAIWIHDTGVGIDETDIPRVMKPFEKAETAGHQNDGGMGLGLPVSSALVELHGGKLVIESEVAIGTSVYFTLPFAGDQTTLKGAT